MKKFTKIALLVLMLALTLALSVLPAFAAGEPTEGAESGTVAPDAEIMPGEGGGIGVSVDFSRFVNSLQYMWKGMLCIFIVIGVIIAVTWMLNKVVNYIVDTKNAKKNGEE